MELIVTIMILLLFWQLIHTAGLLAAYALARRPSEFLDVARDFAKTMPTILPTGMMAAMVASFFESRVAGLNTAKNDEEWVGLDDLDEPSIEISIEPPSSEPEAQHSADGEDLDVGQHLI